MELIIQQTAEALERNFFKAVVCSNTQQVLTLIDDMAQDAQIIGLGGSMTLRNMGVIERLQAKGKQVYTKNLMPKGADFREYGKNIVFSDLFLSSANAITKNGWIINVDGSGNRVGALAFGPRKTLIVAGRNKLVDTVEEGRRRVSIIAAPKMCQRLQSKTPCAINGVCTDCNSHDRSCRITEILERCPRFVDITVALVDEDLGY